MNDAPPPYRTVVFDCDSTLCSIEGIDELAEGRITPEDRRQLEAWTEDAMAGKLPLEAVFARRLEKVAPSRAELIDLGQRYVDTLLPGAFELIARLRKSGTRVLIVSGGLLPAVAELAKHLSIPSADVSAVDVRFDRDGNYLEFDRTSPLARSGGKLELIRGLGGAVALGPLAWVGDGITDLEAAPECARFVAFGGVTQRPAVQNAARVRVLEPNFAALGPLLLAEPGP